MRISVEQLCALSFIGGCIFAVGMLAVGAAIVRWAASSK